MESLNDISYNLFHHYFREMHDCIALYISTSGNYKENPCKGPALDQCLLIYNVGREG